MAPVDGTGQGKNDASDATRPLTHPVTQSDAEIDASDARFDARNAGYDAGPRRTECGIAGASGAG